MPGLEDMATAMKPYTACSEDDILRHLLFVAWYWAFGSRNTLSAALDQGFLWREIRASAREVGRELPAHSPSQNTFSKFREKFPTVGSRAAAAFVPAMAPLVRAAGLLVPTDPRWHAPCRANTIVGDGTVFKAASDVMIDPVSGLANGSRSSTGRPRIAPRYHGKSDTDVMGRAGVPVAMIGVRDNARWQRAVVGVGTYFDRNECAAAMRLFDATLDVYGSGVHGFAYDKLMNGRQQQQVMRAGVVPMVNMPNAADGTPSLCVPDYLQEVLGSRAQPKTRAVCQYLRSVDVPVGSGVCRHHLFALDGALVATVDGEIDPTWSSTPCTQIGLRFETGTGRAQRLIGTYRVPCRHHHPLIEIEHSGDRTGSDGTAMALADWLRPIDISTRSVGHGLRQDIESTFSTSKRRMALDGRASSFTLDCFLFDVVGFGLWANSALWDVHVAQHTPNGQKGYLEIINKRLRAGHRPF